MKTHNVRDEPIYKVLVDVDGEAKLLVVNYSARILRLGIFILRLFRLRHENNTELESKQASKNPGTAFSLSLPSSALARRGLIL